MWHFFKRFFTVVDVYVPQKQTKGENASVSFDTNGWNKNTCWFQQSQLHGPVLRISSSREPGSKGVYAKFLTPIRFAKNPKILLSLLKGGRPRMSHTSEKDHRMWRWLGTTIGCLWTPTNLEPRNSYGFRDVYQLKQRIVRPLTTSPTCFTKGVSRTLTKICWRSLFIARIPITRSGNIDTGRWFSSSLKMVPWICPWSLRRNFTTLEDCCG